MEILRFPDECPRSPLRPAALRPLHLDLPLSNIHVTTADTVRGVTQYQWCEVTVKCTNTRCFYVTQIHFMTKTLLCLKEMSVLSTQLHVRTAVKV